MGKEREKGKRKPQVGPSEDDSPFRQELLQLAKNSLHNDVTFLTVEERERRRTKKREVFQWMKIGKGEVNHTPKVLEGAWQEEPEHLLSLLVSRSSSRRHSKWGGEGKKEGKEGRRTSRRKKTKQSSQSPLHQFWCSFQDLTLKLVIWSVQGKLKENRKVKESDCLSSFLPH